jgi:formylglycine-generating enzyme required for sulfatase activity
VLQWVQDCYRDNYDGAPTDGSAWTSGDCSNRVARGGSWGNRLDVRSALRLRLSSVYRNDNLGFRVGRTLVTP